MYIQNIRTITCNACCEPAIEYDNNVESVDSYRGRVTHCLSCSVLGRVDIDGDEDGSYVIFLPLDKKEVSHVDFGTIVDAYEAAQKKIEDLYEEVSRLRSQADLVKKPFLKVV